LYSTTSRPSDPPKTGKIAIKVINHYGDEVLKVYPIIESGVASINRTLIDRGHFP